MFNFDSRELVQWLLTSSDRFLCRFCLSPHRHIPDLLNLRNHVLEREPSTNAGRTWRSIYNLSIHATECQWHCRGKVEVRQDACDTPDDVFKAKHDDNKLKERLGNAWSNVQRALSRAGDSNLRGHLRNESKFDAYNTPGSNREQELIKLLRRMAKKEVFWGELFKHGALLFIRLTPSTLMVVFYL
jgi:hypothetical protein